MKASIWKVFVGTLVILGTSFQAHALTIDPATTAACGSATCLVTTGNQTSQAQINAFIAGILGISVEVYKQNVGEAFDTGVFAGSYTTTFTNEPLDPSDALIHYNGGPSITGSPIFLLVKDGNHSPAWYLYKLAWNGTDDIVLDNFWPAGGAISHVTLYGSTSVPDGGSMTMLLGIGLMGLAGLRRFLS